jgi:murein DD-endopeptidase MepM/ murein hydrolase activator NlpD
MRRIAGEARLPHNPLMRAFVAEAATRAARAAGGVLLLFTASCAFLEVGPDDETASTRGSIGGSAGPPVEARRFPPPPPKPALPSASVFPSESAAVPRADQQPRERGVHRVRQGETVYGIAHQHGVDAYALITTNALTPPFDLIEGQRLRLPGSVPGSVSGPRPAADSPPATAEVGSARPPERPAGMAAPRSETVGGERAALPRQAEPPPEPPPQSAGGFLWPVEGRILSGFGAKGGGLYNDGINIAAAAGVTVRAAESGVVAYAGNELRGFGNMLLIKHNGGWVTTYAHNQDLLVKRGERVRRGQTIARVGSSGSVDQPQLHFEIRKGKRAVDPLRQLPRPSAAARGGDAG